MDRRENGTGLVNDEKMCPIDEQNSLVKIVKQKNMKMRKNSVSIVGIKSNCYGYCC